MASTDQTAREVFLLPLTDNGAPDVPGGYIYLPAPSNPPYLIRFSIEGTSSICRQGSLWVNIPDVGQTFQRHRFREFKLEPDFNRNIEISIPVVLAGAFAFYTTHTALPDLSAGVKKPEPTRTPTYYINVSPRLTINREPLPLDALSIFSVISKFMGKYPADWENHLRGIGQRSYNMIHFTPLMRRGSSNSPYSIYDQHSFDSECFPNGESDIARLVDGMERNHGLLGLTDVVWNHTANNSKWLENHPEAGYNAQTAPWLESALELDTALLEFGLRLDSHNLPSLLDSTQDLEKLMDGVPKHVLEPLRLWEYYTLNVERDVKAAINTWIVGDVTALISKEGGNDFEKVDGIADWPVSRKTQFLLGDGATHFGNRFGRTLDPSHGAALLTAWFGPYAAREKATDEAEAYNALVKVLNEINVPFYEEYDADRAVMLEQLFNRIKYLRLDAHGPKLGRVNHENPLIESYFTRLPHNETTSQHNPKSLALVNNGWRWNADAMVDNAGPSSRAYLRREVIVWSDCVKLRYGHKPSDNPHLWEYMARYTRLMAKYFTGFRIDNCHSTPIVVAEYLLDEARRIRPNLLVCAELFTGSEEMDHVFVERLGLSSLIREAMQAWSPGELSRLVHRHGGRPIGSFEVDEAVSSGQTDAPAGHDTGSIGTKSQEVVHRIKQTPVHALFMDCTHDNEVPAQKRDARDTLPNAALVSMCACATGSVMGYDEIYPKLVDLVHETRRYTSAASENGITSCLGSGGIGGVKKFLNDIHTLMGKEGYDETFIHHEGEYITVHRVHPISRNGYFLMAHSAFPGFEGGFSALKPVHLAGTKARSLGSWKLKVDTSQETIMAIVNDKSHLKGLPSQIIELDAAQVEVRDHETIISIERDFPPGSIAMFQTSIPGAEHASGLDGFVTSGSREAFGSVLLTDLNFILYRCEPEERDSNNHRDGVYDVPNHGPLVYAGLQGWWSVLKSIIRNNDLGHPLCRHLRDGQWALDYIVERMHHMAAKPEFSCLEKPTQWLRARFDALRKIPSFLLPRYFALIVQTAYTAAWDRGIQLMNNDIRSGQSFLQSLAMVSVQQTGYSKSASLYPDRSLPCLAAGLPHFASGWARCWGRDVFISLRGLFLGTGRYQDAREHILAFASVLKHGMIPNLLSDGKLPRYNSRDSIWFFLQSIQDYTKLAPNGLDILSDTVSRRFLPYDDVWFEHDDPRAYSKKSTVAEIIQEALQRHASGLCFREANAGPALDMQMRPEGFQIDIKVDWDTGFVFGGNQFNCGTWMDKMGESEKAGSKGIPGTPRDGAAVEITGLLYSTLAWLAELNKIKVYEHKGVVFEMDTVITYEDWASRIEKNFERCYFVPADVEKDPCYDVNANVVNRRGIYKDLYQSGKEYEDYQLRPNFPIAMCVAPRLFTPEHALKALFIVDAVLRGPTGMATLDPKDLNYRPYYNNSEDSADFATSKGRNYHQGPEWVWPTGFFLRALLKFDLLRKRSSQERVESFQQITQRLEGCKAAIGNSSWAGLTELTNKGGAFCGDSSPTQAWSAACLIDLFMDASQLSKGGAGMAASH